jgi:hypothetical protein
MPRVPVLSGPTVDAVLPSTPAPALLQGNNVVGNAISQVGAGVANVADATEKRFTKEKREAEAVIGADADLELDSRLEEVKSETYKLKGLSASEGRSKAVEMMAKHRQEVAARISSAEERNRFLVRSATSVMAARRQVEHYVGSEFEAARQGAQKATQESAVAKAASGVLDPDEFSLVETRGIQTIRDTQRSEEEGTAQIAEFQSKVSAAYTQGLIAQGRVEDAVAYVEKARPTLGARYVEAKALVTRANAGAEKDRLVAEGAKLVDGSAEAVRSEDGFVTEKELRKAVDLEEADPGMRAEIEQALERRVRIEDGKLKDAINKHRDDVNRSDLPGNKPDSAAELFLEKYDPDFLLARQARKRAEARAYKASRSGDARERAAEAKAQKAVDQEFLYRLSAELTNEPATKPDEFLTAFIAEKAKEGDDVMVSDVARAKAGLDAAKASKRSETQEGTADRSAATRFERTLAAASKVKGKPVDQKLLNERVGRAMTLYHQRLEAKGKPLDESELAGIEAELLRDVTVTVPGRFFGTNEVKKKAVDLIEPDAASNDAMVQVRAKATGKTGRMPRSKFDPSKYELVIQ